MVSGEYCNSLVQGCLLVHGNLYYTASAMPVAVLYCERYSYSCAVALLTYVHDALGYFHYAMQFPCMFRLTC